MGEHPPIKPFPLSLFPIAQLRIRALLEEADEETLAGHTRRADYLTNKAREDAAALRASIGGIA